MYHALTIVANKYLIQLNNSIVTWVTKLPKKSSLILKKADTTRRYEKIVKDIVFSSKNSFSENEC